MTSLSRSVFESNAKVVHSGEDCYATIDLYVPAFEQSFEVEIYLEIGAAGASDRTLQTLSEIVSLSLEARSRIRSLLYEDSLRAKENVAFGDPSPPPETPPNVLEFATAADEWPVNPVVKGIIYYREVPMLDQGYSLEPQSNRDSATLARALRGRGESAA